MSTIKESNIRIVTGTERNISKNFFGIYYLSVYSTPVTLYRKEKEKVE